MGSVGTKSKALGGDFNGGLLKSSALEARTEGARIDRDQSVPDMDEPHPEALQTIHACEGPTRLQDSPNFPK